MEIVKFDYRDFGLASYLIVYGNEFIGINLKYVKRFNEFKVFVEVQGNKETLLSLQNQYENNKFKILKDVKIKKQINKLKLMVEDLQSA